ncbi:MAG: hypothetical protein WDN24_11955 [Sphingomonas sp.]
MQARADDPAKLGEWRLEPGLSRLAGPAPAEDLRIYEAAEGGMVRSTHRIRQADGSTSLTVYVARDDGRDYPMFDGAGRQTGTIALRPSGKRSQDFVTRREGKVTGRGRTRISADGRRMTMVIRLDPEGPGQRVLRTIFPAHGPIAVPPSPPR